MNTKVVKISSITMCCLNVLMYIVCVYYVYRKLIFLLWTWLRSMDELVKWMCLFSNCYIHSLFFGDLKPCAKMPYHQTLFIHLYYGISMLWWKYQIKYARTSWSLYARLKFDPQTWTKQKGKAGVSHWH